MISLPVEVQRHAVGFLTGTELAFHVRAVSRSLEEVTEDLLRSDFGPFAVDRRLVPGARASLADCARLTWTERLGFLRLLKRRRGDFFGGAARSPRDLDVALDVRREGRRAFQALDSFVVVLGVAGRHYSFSRAWHARDLRSLHDVTSTWLDFDLSHPLSEEFGGRCEEKTRVIRDLVVSGDVPTACAIFVDSVDALAVDLSLVDVATDRVVDLCCWCVEPRVDEVHVVEGDKVVICDATSVNSLLRHPFDDSGARLHVGAQLEVNLRSCDAAVSFDVRATDEDGDDVPVPPGETVAGFLARALTSGLAERPKGLSFSPTSVADFGAAARPPPFFLT